MTRRLALRREVLRELSTDELASVVGGTRETLYSCMDFESCDFVRCVISVER